MVILQQEALQLIDQIQVIVGVDELGLKSLLEVHIKEDYLALLKDQLTINFQLVSSEIENPDRLVEAFRSYT